MEDLRKTLNEAAKAVEDLPEHLQEVAFSIILERRLEHGSSAGAEGNSAEPESDSATNESNNLPWLDDVIDDLPDTHDVADGTRREQAAWAVTYLVADEKSATTESVRDTIKTRLGVTPQSSANMSSTLGDLTPKYLSREGKKEGKGYTYMPTVNVADLFE
jgi:hypothetical protein